LQLAPSMTPNLTLALLPLRSPGVSLSGNLDSEGEALLDLTRPCLEEVLATSLVLDLMEWIETRFSH